MAEDLECSETEQKPIYSIVVKNQFNSERYILIQNEINDKSLPCVIITLTIQFNLNCGQNLVMKMKMLSQRNMHQFSSTLSLKRNVPWEVAISFGEKCGQMSFVVYKLDVTWVHPENWMKSMCTSFGEECTCHLMMAGS